MLYCVQVHISHAPEKEKDQLRREFAQIWSPEGINSALVHLAVGDDKFIDVEELFSFSDSELERCKDLSVMAGKLSAIGATICSLAFT